MAIASFPHHSRPSLSLPRGLRWNPSSAPHLPSAAFVLPPILTPHPDNVAFNQLSLGISPHFDGRRDCAAGTPSPACQLRVIHPFQFPTMHLIRGSAVLKWLRSALGKEVRLGPHPCGWKSSTCAHVRRLLTPHYHFTTPRYETAEL